MLGSDSALKLDQGWGLSNEFQHLPLSALEKQVYSGSQEIIKVLTNRRLINLISIRPVDILVQILVSTVE